ncbi:flagellar protein FliT [Idiomarina abyssalis]|uniref:flagellar protein FliT n=1 Tax=Idiomarina abyssalis TaxID=86102 RepID=UPI003A905207
MDTITALSLELLQTTKALLERCQTGDVDDLNALQLHRTELVQALDLESQKPYPRDVLVGCRSLLDEAQSLEKEALKYLQQQRDEAGSAYQKLKAADKARKAYDRFK